LIDAAQYPRVDELRSEFATRYRMFDDLVDRCASMFGPDWIRDLEASLEKLFPDHEALASGVKGYGAFVMDILRRQRKFETERAYVQTSFDDAAREVYLDDTYMSSEYLPGLLLSHYLWPHHYRQSCFFDTAFVGPLRAALADHFVEVGVGTGMYSRRLLQALPAASGAAYDISPAAKAFAERHVAAFGYADRYHVHLRNVLTEPVEPCQWLVCVEVLEHMEDPLSLLRILRRTLVDGGRAFITAAINAPNVDHIYLYTTADEVVAQLVEARFGLEQAFIGPAYVPRQPDLPVPTVAAFVVV
jgi:2-polyprenyl-3-methyl-5-hydroxy-6-metoxy-1,4-benzoquinol methylase